MDNSVNKLPLNRLKTLLFNELPNYINPDDDNISKLFYSSDIIDQIETFKLFRNLPFKKKLKGGANENNQNYRIENYDSDRDDCFLILRVIPIHDPYFQDLISDLPKLMYEKIKEQLK